ncbi:MAG: RNA methyltransferase [Lachnospiraceae bacterium]|nr:RNA methyltransferase [Lachnospiraceae bacterium]
MELPESFIERMKIILGNGYNSFISSYNEEKQPGLRINTLKLNIKERDRLPFHLVNVPWAEEGFYYNQDERPGRHPLHEAGVYYIQEPSAMSVASLLEPGEGDFVCDLCAAPGGKSTHIAGRLNGRGLLVANEISASRAKILSQNIERLGIYNALVCNEPPDRMAGHFPEFFDKILVDAPCSGEGMFRKDTTAVEEWSIENVRMCAARQKEILNCAARMLKPGGVLVYSTCTFSPDEDEDMLVWFLREHKEYKVQDWKASGMAGSIREQEIKDNIPDSGETGFITGGPGSLSQEEEAAVKGALRLWPHKIKGEGHFAVKFIKDSVACDENYIYNINRKKKNTDKKQIYISKKELEEIQKWLGEVFITSDLGWCNERLRFFGDMLYLMPEGINNIEGIKVLRQGLHIAVRKKNRYEPAHALAKAAVPELPGFARQYYDCSDGEALQYLHGETISCPEEFKGWVLIGYRGFPLGWGKAHGGIAKNHYPKGLRI